MAAAALDPEIPSAPLPGFGVAAAGWRKRGQAHATLCVVRPQAGATMSTMQGKELGFQDSFPLVQAQNN